MEKGGMESHNHAMFAGIGTALFTHLAGIRPLSPGYCSASIEPLIPTELGRLECSVSTVRGDISLQWRKEQGALTLTVQIPAAIEGHLTLPFGGQTYILHGGRHTFLMPLPSENPSPLGPPRKQKHD